MATCKGWVVLVVCLALVSGMEARLRHHRHHRHRRHHHRGGDDLNSLPQIEGGFFSGLTVFGEVPKEPEEQAPGASLLETQANDWNVVNVQAELKTGLLTPFNPQTKGQSKELEFKLQIIRLQQGTGDSAVYEAAKQLVCTTAGQPSDVMGGVPGTWETQWLSELKSSQFASCFTVTFKPDYFKEKFQGATESTLGFCAKDLSESLKWHKLFQSVVWYTTPTSTRGAFLQESASTHRHRHHHKLHHLVAAWNPWAPMGDAVFSEIADPDLVKAITDEENLQQTLDPVDLADYYATLREQLNWQEIEDIEDEIDSEEGTEQGTDNTVFVEQAARNRSRSSRSAPQFSGFVELGPKASVPWQVKNGLGSKYFTYSFELEGNILNQNGLMKIYRPPDSVITKDAWKAKSLAQRMEVLNCFLYQNDPAKPETLKWHKKPNPNCNAKDVSEYTGKGALSFEVFPLCLECVADTGLAVANWGDRCKRAADDRTKVDTDWLTKFLPEYVHQEVVAPQTWEIVHKAYAFTLDDVRKSASCLVETICKPVNGQPAACTVLPSSLHIHVSFPPPAVPETMKSISAYVMWLNDIVRLSQTSRMKAAYDSPYFGAPPNAMLIDALKHQIPNGYLALEKFDGDGNWGEFKCGSIALRHNPYKHGRVGIEFRGGATFPFTYIYMSDTKDDFPSFSTLPLWETFKSDKTREPVSPENFFTHMTANLEILELLLRPLYLAKDADINTVPVKLAMPAATRAGQKAPEPSMQIKLPDTTTKSYTLGDVMGFYQRTITTAGKLSAAKTDRKGTGALLPIPQDQSIRYSDSCEDDGAHECPFSEFNPGDNKKPPTFLKFYDGMKAWYPSTNGFGADRRIRQLTLTAYFDYIGLAKFFLGLDETSPTLKVLKTAVYNCRTSVFDTATKPGVKASDIDAAVVSSCTKIYQALKDLKFWKAL